MSIATIGFSQQWEWAKKINGLANDYVSDIYVDDSLNVYVTGRTKFQVTFEDDNNPIMPPYYGHTDAFMAKYDKDGNLLWAQQGGSPEPEWGWGITVDKWGNVYCTGELSDTSTFGNQTLISNGIRDVFITKLDPNGNFIWTKSFGGTGTDKGKGITTDNEGNVYVVGHIYDQVTIGNTTIGTPTTGNSFIIKMDSAGNYLNVESIEPRYSATFKIKSDKKGSLYICGELLYDNYIAGYPVLGPTSLQWRDAFIAKLDTALQTQWVNTVAGSLFNLGEDIAISEDYVYLTGFYTYTVDASGISLTYNGNGTNSTTINDARDIFITKYKHDGSIVWAKGIGGLGYDYAYGIDIGVDESVYITGVYEDTVMFDNYQLVSVAYEDIFVTKLDSNANVVWAKSQGDVLNDYMYCIALDKYNNVYCGGTYPTSQQFDTIAMNTVYNNYSGIVLKLVESPVYDTVFSNSILCDSDTFSISIETITSPINYQFNLSPNGWVIDNTYYFVANQSVTSISGNIIVSNNIYSDTIIINQNLTVNQPIVFSLGNDTTTCDTVIAITLNAPQSQQNYLWSTNEITSSINVNQSGTYWVDVTDVNNCVSSDTILVSFVNCSGINEINKKVMFTYYQNNQITISGIEKVENISIYSVDGRLQKQNNQTPNVWVNDLPKGSYILVVNRNRYLTYKFVVY